MEGWEGRGVLFKRNALDDTCEMFTKLLLAAHVHRLVRMAGKK